MVITSFEVIINAFIGFHYKCIYKKNGTKLSLLDADKEFVYNAFVYKEFVYNAFVCDHNQKGIFLCCRPARLIDT